MPAVLFMLRTWTVLSGYFNCTILPALHCAVQVRLGRLQNLVFSACVENLGIEEQGGRLEVQTVQVDN